MDKKVMPVKQQIVVLYPGPGVGHVVPMVQLAKVFLRHGYDVTMVLAEPPVGSPDYRIVDVDRVAASNPAITFHVLHPVLVTDLAGSGKPPFLRTLQVLRRYNDELESFLRSIPRQRLHSLVTGMFSAYAVDVAAKLGVPVYTFFASAATTLAVVTQMPALLAGRTTGLKELGETPLEILGVPPFPASHLIRELLEHPEDELCKAMVDVWKRNTDTSGILVNTFESLESRAVQALRNPRCVPGRVLPPIYCVGPLVGGDGTSAADQDRAKRHVCIAWLDAQPERSVVFLCFGSRGTHSAEQLREIAVGLDRCGQRFLWAVRTPAGTDDLENLDALLPEGFLERTKDRGLVVRSWAPQVDVLHHPSTGAFVTHCGWNSTLEGVTAGVPMLCWPLYAEQMLNKVLITEVMGVGVEIEGYRAGFITAEALETKVGLVMESAEGTELRERVVGRKNEAKAAMLDGGSSQTSFVRFLSDVENLDEQLGK
ncbi:anthocyanidin 5,3-O-glucosyltransferase-like [Phragmites australis]|uniref:anthocyanidin 5,3-O-glucosyltransferase-like n=1 Tax=Phragmites australis TaxID=29695 RepID=UPI002D77727C|nr:anthocyanidin 5,3-O-glucosyltransferase-like [Phragmites australis]